MQIVRQPWFKHVCTLMVAVMLVVGFVPRVDAKFISSTDAYTAADRNADLAGVRKTLENKIVTQRLQDFGYSRTEIDDRLAQLSDKDLHTLASNVEDIDMAGGAIGFVIGILLIVLLVIVILKLTDKTVTVS